MIETTMPVLPAGVETKTPVARLLDMIASYSQYVSDDKTADSLVQPEDVGALYQEAGGLLEIDAADAQAEEEAVRQFVAERVLPLLLRRR